MTRRAQRRLATLLAGAACFLPATAPAESLPLAQLVLPPGFHITLLTDAVPAAREMLSFISVPPRSLHPALRQAAAPALPSLTHDV